MLFDFSTVEEPVSSQEEACLHKQMAKAKFGPGYFCFLNHTMSVVTVLERECVSVH